MTNIKIKRRLTTLGWVGLALGFVGVNAIEMVPIEAQYLFGALVALGGLAIWLLLGFMIFWEVKAPQRNYLRWFVLIGVPFFGALVLASFDLRNLKIREGAS